jgi:hypothetical protein
MPTWDPISGGPDSNRRRSQRAIVKVAITVRTDGSPQDASFEEKTHTLVVNAHGALIELGGKVEKGQTLWLRNHTTREEILCNVVYLGRASGSNAQAVSKTQVGIEFATSSPAFWHILFPLDTMAMAEQTLSASKPKKTT